MELVESGVLAQEAKGVLVDASAREQRDVRSGGAAAGFEARGLGGPRTRSAVRENAIDGGELFELQDGGERIVEFLEGMVERGRQTAGSGEDARGEFAIRRGAAAEADHDARGAELPRETGVRGEQGRLRLVIDLVARGFADHHAHRQRRRGDDGLDDGGARSESAERGRADQFDAARAAVLGLARVLGRLADDFEQRHRGQYDAGAAPMKRVLLSWSSGKDSAWCLHVLRGMPDVEVAGLVTSFNGEAGRVAMHGARRELVEAQVRAAELPLWSVELPWPCSNAEYERLLAVVWERARDAGIEAVAFGDLYLADVRAYRERQLAGTGLDPMFPLWQAPTGALAREMLAAGLRARLVCVDPARVPESWAGRPFDLALLDELPAGCDPCGENGEFHTFVHAGPMFRAEIGVRAGVVVRRDGFVFADLMEDTPSGGGDAAVAAQAEAPSAPLDPMARKTGGPDSQPE